MTKKEKQHLEQMKKNSATGAAFPGAAPGGAAEPERMPGHRKTPGDRAIDVLDNHTPEIDL